MVVVGIAVMAVNSLYNNQYMVINYYLHLASFGTMGTVVLMDTVLLVLSVVTVASGVVVVVDGCGGVVLAEVVDGTAGVVPIDRKQNSSWSPTSYSTIIHAP